MESRHLAVLLKQTLDPTTQAEAAAELDKVSKIIGFAPGILQVIISWGRWYANFGKLGSRLNICRRGKWLKVKSKAEKLSSYWSN